MKITNGWIIRNEPCSEAIDWWDKKERDSTKILKKLIRERKYDWAGWLIARVMKKKQHLMYIDFVTKLDKEVLKKQGVKWAMAWGTVWAGGAIWSAWKRGLAASQIKALKKGMAALQIKSLNYGMKLLKNEKVNQRGSHGGI